MLGILLMSPNTFLYLWYLFYFCYLSFSANSRYVIFMIQLDYDAPLDHFFLRISSHQWTHILAYAPAKIWLCHGIYAKWIKILGICYDGYHCWFWWKVMVLKETVDPKLEHNQTFNAHLKLNTYLLALFRNLQYI